MNTVRKMTQKDKERVVDAYLGGSRSEKRYGRISLSIFCTLLLFTGLIEFLFGWMNYILRKNQ